MLTRLSEIEIDTLNFDEKGLIPAIVQSSATREVLMLAYMNRESLGQTFRIGETVFYSRSRGQLWHKGSTSGNTQKVEQISFDCDRDTLLISVNTAGPACHRDTVSCFEVED